jgi:hypothetical protein
MPIKQTLNKHLTSKLQVSPNFTLDSVADIVIIEENTTLVVF